MKEINTIKYNKNEEVKKKTTTYICDKFERLFGLLLLKKKNTIDKNSVITFLEIHFKQYFRLIFDFTDIITFI